ncbi:MAG: hypothetical protein QQN63_04510 [Nitrosopumilus sp.]
MIFSFEFRRHLMVKGYCLNWILGRFKKGWRPEFIMIHYRYIIVILFVVVNALLLANFITITSKSRFVSSDFSGAVPRSFFLEIIEDTPLSTEHVSWSCIVRSSNDQLVLSGTGSSLHILRIGPPYQIDCHKTTDVEGDIFFYLKLMFILDGDELPTSRYLGSANINEDNPKGRISWPAR